jgi:DNA-binding CsgD family transcriptional regulator
MLLGRDEERLALDRLFAEARDGRSGALGIVGEPGIGKTALLDYAAAGADGMRVLRARGIESEAEVPFAGLAELLRPALNALDRIPEPQAAALAGALALAPATAGDRFAIGAATLSLLSACADDEPLALLVDDAHLLDGSSAGALLFAARRLIADRVAIVLTVREGEPSLLDGADLRLLHVVGLGRTAATELLAETNAPTAAFERLYLATGGNPLALLELARDSEPVPALPGEAPVPISAHIAAAFLGRSGRLPGAARRLLVLASASDGGDLAVLARAAESLSLHIDELAPAEAAGLVSMADGKLEFRHPLVRSAVYSEAPPARRRAAHAALAAVLPDRDIDRRAWHLAAASVGPDARACAALEQAGARARERSAYAVASAALERSAQLSATPSEGARLRYEAADAASLAGDMNRTVALLDDAQPHADGLTDAHIDHLRGRVALRRGPVAEGTALIARAAERVADSEPELAVVMLAQAVHGGFYSGDTRAMLAAADRARELATAHDSHRARFFAALAEGQALIAAGQGDVGAHAMRRAVATLEISDDLRDDPWLRVWATLAPLWLREGNAGRGLLERAFDQARDLAAVGALPILLHPLARHQATTDQWQAAESSYDEAIRLARETGQDVELAASLAGLAWLHARQGREASCRTLAAEAAALCADLGIGLYGAWAIQALGDLELALGRPAEAAVHHEAQLHKLRSLGIADVDVSPAPELVESYLRLGRAEEAAATAADYRVAAESKAQPWALARARRCDAAVAEPAATEALFKQSLALHARTPDVFETARTHLAYGARLRRMRKRVRAREQLRTALEDFDRLGAAPWADQARVELAATGETARRRDASTLDDLTPQELQIARLLAAGKTTREAAAAAFLSPKTVEYHLGHVYLKLAINSREELTAAFNRT